MSVAEADLRSVELLRDVDAEALAPLMAGSTVRTFAPGDRLTVAGAEPAHLLLVLDGEVESFSPEDSENVQRTHVAPTYLGAISILSESPWPSVVRAGTPARVALVPGDAFVALLAADPRVLRDVVRAILAAMRTIEGAAQRQERLATLGRISAGLAHELNNPAAAARRAVEPLAEALETVQRTLGAFVESGVERAEAERLVALQREAMRRAAEAPVLDVLDASEREDALVEALEDLGIQEAWTLAEQLAAAGLDAAWLEEVVRLAGAAGEAALRWTAASLTAQGLADELREATDRISGLVAAVKDYSYMDQATSQDVDVHAGLESTLVILGHKLEDGGATIVREYDRELPRIPAFGSELNQVWTVLLEHAIDAGGTVTLRTARDGPSGVAVEVAASGAELGTEGLDTARRIVVERHRGRFERAPDLGGGTLARVTLPG